jgi:NRAMP (natural resistance-associated macrophage protein)-like metal ion transporter
MFCLSVGAVLTTGHLAKKRNSSSGKEALGEASTDGNLLRRLGPGLITGASDDDPSGIATYSQAGAQFGFGLLWTMLFTLPLMVAIQEICARIGRVTGHGIAGSIRRRYSRWLAIPVVVLMLVANTINIGADIGAMGDAVRLLIGGPALAYAAGFALLCVLLEVLLRYRNYAAYLKWLTLALFSYVATAFVVHVAWGAALRQTVIPSFGKSSDYWATFIAVLGTTISPYLFFWQASQETEEIRSNPDQHRLKKNPAQAKEQFGRIKFDTWVGMIMSNLVAYFIILAAATTLHAHKITDVQTSTQAAKALEPIAGRFATWLFALGIVGTGLLAVPVLAGSAAYGLSEAAGWRIGLDQRAGGAKAFYGVLAAATMVGLLINFPRVQHATHLSPIKALFWSAVINGVAAGPIMVVIMLMSHSKGVMGEYARTSIPLKIVGWLSTLAMLGAAAGMFLTMNS